MKVAIVGSRKFKSPDLVRNYVNSLDDDDTVVSGCAEGPDTIAENVAKRRGLHVSLYPVKTDDLGYFPEGRQHFRERAFKRNRKIADECDRMVAFWDGVSRGTTNAMKQAAAAGKKVEFYDPLGEKRVWL